MSHAELLTAAEAVARLAGDVARQHFHTALEVETKGDGSPVTAADRAAERAAREWLGRKFPDDGILGEELGVTRPEARRRWMIDPIDGTKSFVHGVPLWGTLVAAVEGQVVLAGAAYFPATGEMLVAAPGEGCWLNGSRCRASECAKLDQSTIVTTDERFGGDPQQRAAWQRLANRVALSRTWGDCYGYLLVASGRAEVMIDGRLSPWDAAPLQPIVEEAGGVFTDWTGSRTPFGGSAVATNAKLAMEVRAILAAPPGFSPGNRHA